MALIKQREDVKEYILDQLKDELRHINEDDNFSSGVMNCDGAELPNRFLNENYFIIGTRKAKQWLGDQTFEAIEKIREYEQDNFGEVSTKFDCPQSVANMLAYVLGEEILQSSDHLNKYCWDRLLNAHSLKIIASQL